MTTLTVITPRQMGAVSSSDLAQFLHMNLSEDLDAFNIMLDAAHDLVERETGLTLITTTYQEVRDSWGPTQPNGALRLLTGPLQSVVSVELTDASGAVSLVSPSYFRATYGSAPAELAPTTLAMRQPTARAAGVRIVYVSGFGDTPDLTPGGLKLAVLQLAAYTYQHRGEADAPVALLDRLLGPYRRVRL